WNIRPTAQWLHDKPLSAAAAWAAADVHREHDPIAARHADQWEAIFTQQGVRVDEIRADAPAAVGQHQAPPHATAADAVEIAGALAAAEVATGAVLAGAADTTHETAHTETSAAGDATSATTGGGAQWSAYADGAAAAALGGRGVSTPPNRVLATSRETP